MNSAYPSWLADLAARVAAGDGDEHPQIARYVRTTRRAAMAAISGGWMREDQEVFLVVLRGNFVHLQFRGPPGARPPRGTVVTFTADPVTQNIYDFGISDTVPDLSALGQVHELPFS